MEILDNEAEDLFGVIECIPTYNLDGKRESFFDDLEHGDGLMDFADIGRMGDFPDGQFFLGINDDVIAVAPEISDLFFGRGREISHHAQSGIGVSFEDSGFLKAFGGGGFQVILPHFRQDGTGVHDQMLASNQSFFEKSFHQLNSNIL